jgi:hypothetical protein
MGYKRWMFFPRKDLPMIPQAFAHAKARSPVEATLATLFQELFGGSGKILGMKGFTFKFHPESVQGSLVFQFHQTGPAGKFGIKFLDPYRVDLLVLFPSQFFAFGDPLVGLYLCLDG